MKKLLLVLMMLAGPVFAVDTPTFTATVTVPALKVAVYRATCTGTCPGLLLNISKLPASNVQGLAEFMYTPTITPTFTLTATHTVTATNTNTPTHTVTVTHTNTPTHTVTMTPTITPTLFVSNHIQTNKLSVGTPVSAEAKVNIGTDSPTSIGLVIQGNTYSSSSTIAPNAASGLQFWYDATSLALSDGNTVTSFTDLSGNSRAMTTDTGNPIYKTNIQNGNAAVSFGGAAGLKIAGIGTNAACGVSSFTLFAVVKITNGATNNAFLFANGAASEADRINMNIGYSGTAYLDFGQRKTGTAYPTNEWMLVRVKRTNSGATTVIKGVTTLWTGTYSANLSNTTSTMRLGSYDGTVNNLFWNGYIGEFCWYNVAISDTDEANVCAGLAGKWGVTGPDPIGVSIPQSADLLQLRNSAGATLGGFTKDADFYTNTNTAGAALIGNGAAFVPNATPGFCKQYFDLQSGTSVVMNSTPTWETVMSKVVTSFAAYGSWWDITGGVQARTDNGAWAAQLRAATTPIGGPSTTLQSDHGASTYDVECKTIPAIWAVPTAYVGVGVTIDVQVNKVVAGDPASFQCGKITGKEFK